MPRHDHIAAALLIGVMTAVGAAPAAAQAQQPQVTARVDQRSITLDDELRLTLTLEGSFDRYQEPSHDGFTVASRSQSQQLSIINGAVSKSLELTFVLRPEREGELTIGSALLLRGGQVVARSAPLKVRVAKAYVPPPVSAGKARDLAAMANQRFFVHAETPRESYYVGEPFVITFSLFFRRDLHVESWELVSAPKLEGLIVEELMQSGDRPQFETRRVGGRVLKALPRSQMLAIASKPGEVLIDTMTARIAAGTMFRLQRHTVRSQPFELTIKPLPEAGRPKGFHPANIGALSMTASVRDGAGQTPSRIETGQRLVLEVAVSGRGNLVGLRAPELVDPDKRFDVQPLPVSADDELRKDEGGVSGTRTFQYLLTPLVAGSYATPKVRLVAFDPDEERYETLTRNGVALEVSGRTLSAEPGTAAYEGEDVRPIFEDAVLEARDTEPFAGSVPFWLLVLGPLAGVAFVEGRHRWRERLASDPVGRRARGAGSNAAKRLSAAERAMRDGLVKDFYGQVARTLTSYVEERANLPVTGMTHDELRASMLDVGYPEEVVEEVITELENCDFARFAPAADVDRQMKEALARAGQAVRQLERVRPRRQP